LFIAERAAIVKWAAGAERDLYRAGLPAVWNRRMPWRLFLCGEISWRCCNYAEQARSVNAGPYTSTV
jgi:hypothetical protein